MKAYPSIQASTGQKFVEFDAYVFEKLDGSNLRFSYSKKSGWNKFGTRHRLFDKSDPAFGPAIDNFMTNLSEGLAKIFHDERYESAIAFCEYYGPTTLGGLQTAEDDHSLKKLSCFDIDVYKKGLLGPAEFIKLTEGKIDTPRSLGKMKWTRGLVQRVRDGDFEGASFEGIVGKAGVKANEIFMAKAKQQRWIDAILARYGETEGQKLVDS